MSAFLEMLDLDARARAVDAITAAIERSFLEDQSRQTQSEIKRRFNICLGLVGEMRTDLHWSWQRITDTLPTALRSKLDGASWSPSTRTAWSHDEASGLFLPPSVK